MIPDLLAVGAELLDAPQFAREWLSTSLANESLIQGYVVRAGLEFGFLTLLLS